MRKRWKRWGLLAGGVLGLAELLAAPALAQGPGMPGLPGMPGFPGMPGGPGMMAPPGFAADPQACPPGPDFPNAAPPSQEPASPFSIKDDGMPNAFSDLVDPRGCPPTPYCFAFRAEYLNWRVSSGRLATPLLTTSNNAIPTGSEVGALDEPGTSILVDAGTYGYRNVPGGRATIGLGFGLMPPIEISGMWLNRTRVLFQGGSTDATGQFLARPIQLFDQPIAPGIGDEDVEFVNVPGIAAGGAAITSRLRLWSLETNIFLRCWESDVCGLDFILGYRHADFGENLSITNTLGPNASVNFGGTLGFPTGFATAATDNFRSRSLFDGGNLGLRATLNTGRVTFFTDLKLGIGSTHHTLDIFGESTLFQPSATRPTQTLPGGVLALPSNSGTTTRTDFSIIPELNTNVSLQLHPCFRIFAGYSLLYWSSVVRAGDHVNSIVDSRQIPTDANFVPNLRSRTPARPEIQTRDFWANGVNVGIEIGF